MSKDIHTSCSCGCGTLRVTKFDFEVDSEYIISYMKDEFNNYEYHIFKAILERLKRTWYTLIGKEYYLFDIGINSEQFEEFKKQINEL